MRYVHFNVVGKKQVKILVVAFYIQKKIGRVNAELELGFLSGIMYGLNCFYFQYNFLQIINIIIIILI